MLAKIRKRCFTELFPTPIAPMTLEDPGSEKQLQVKLI
jgi:hypothetical protein